MTIWKKKTLQIFVKKCPCLYEKADKDYQKIREKMEIEEDAAKM